ncbi:hypothetical protein HYPSUDRAFT_907934 [Hypholoma sublateritium FD-334 SS-4]|uniref:DUF6533 domain-containing protein n=1 Tax=Hypholoma sublateritium (strain FD-334 SS-4) TaxID=945553 RepID=A0A0D2M7G7_HYPSF|nr:hypothetical protein HYPSUDRAFT_907934 [Hypholoma sublateritium FD-334 SS-4]
MSAPPPLSEPLIAHIAHDLMALKMYSLATFVMFYYDTLITFGDEVERVWKRKFTWFTVLWFLNRYVPLIGFAIFILAFHDSAWTRNDKFCDVIAFTPGVLGFITSTVIDLIFIVRLYATFSANKAILYFMVPFLCAKEAVVIWSVSSGHRQPLPPGLVGCILVPGSSSLRFTALWIAQLTFDTTVFVLTAYRAFKLSRIARGGVQSLIDMIMRDGVIYFAVIFIADFVNVLTFLLAPADLQAVNASLTISIGPLMVSRLILNLRGAHEAQKTRMSHTTGTGSNNSAQRGTLVGSKRPYSAQTWLTV